MSTLQVAVPAKKATLEATIIRKDGTVEQLGTVAYWHERRICRWLFALEQHVQRLRKQLEK